MAERSILYKDLWLIYRQSPHLQSQINHWFNLEKHLPIYTPDMQAEVLDGAPPEIIQSVVHLLDIKARKKLGLPVKETRKKKKEWLWGALL